MIDSDDDTIERADACATCGVSVIGRRYVQADASGFPSFCSEKCLVAAVTAQRKRRWRMRRRR